MTHTRVWNWSNHLDVHHSGKCGRLLAIHITQGLCSPPLHVIGDHNVNLLNLGVSFRAPLFSNSFMFIWCLKSCKGSIHGIPHRSLATLRESNKHYRLYKLMGSMWYIIYGDVVYLNGIYVLTIHALTINQHPKWCLTQWGKDILLSQWGDPICVIT